MIYWLLVIDMVISLMGAIAFAVTSGGNAPGLTVAAILGVSVTVAIAGAAIVHAIDELPRPGEAWEALNVGSRFYRRLKILPGVSVNLSRSGVSASVGVKGAYVTVGHGQVRETVGLPGTGLSYTTTQKTH